MYVRISASTSLFYVEDRGLFSLYIFFLSVRNTRSNRLNEKCCLNEKKAGLLVFTQTRA